VINERHYGADHLQLAFTYGGLGAAEKTSGNLEEARKHFQRAYDLFSAGYGPDHAHSRWAFKALSNLPTSTGRAEREAHFSSENGSNFFQKPVSTERSDGVDGGIEVGIEVAEEQESNPKERLNKSRRRCVIC
jgi:hypothetical protein